MEFHDYQTHQPKGLSTKKQATLSTLRLEGGLFCILLLFIQIPDILVNR